MEELPEVYLDRVNQYLHGFIPANLSQEERDAIYRRNFDAAVLVSVLSTLLRAERIYTVAITTGHFELLWELFE